MHFDLKHLTPASKCGRFVALFTLLLLLAPAWAEACTSAIVSGRLTENGRPLLWKNRDTGCQDNRVERHPAHDGLLEFVALFDARDTRDTAAWMGFNERGFAIMNTASYNLNNDKVPASEMDREGVVMRYALERCTTVDDFERVLQQLPKPLGVEANFGVMDAQGGGAYFETGNYTYKKYDLADEPSGILTRTNYSFSGRKDEGYGYIRHENEKHLLAPYVLQRSITPSLFTEVISRTFYHSLKDKDFTYNEQWVVDQDFIPRAISTASVVIEGVLPGEPADLTTMWIALGYPPCAETFACWTGEGGVPEVLTGTTAQHHSKQCDLVNKRETEVFHNRKGNGKLYIDLSKLYNSRGTGYCQVLIPRNMEVYRQGAAERDRRKALSQSKNQRHGRTR